MKVLILTVTSGEGHNAIAKALNNELKNHNVETQIIDCFKKKYWLGEKVLDKGYLFLYKYLKCFMNYFYKKGQKALADSKDSGWFTYAVRRVKRKVFEEIEQYEPDFIICTHTLAARIVIEMRKEYKGMPKSLAILSDYSVHPCWEKIRDIDFVETPSDDFNDILLKKGFTKEQFINLGLPVATKFSNHIDKQQARRNLGLEDIVTLMIMNGGCGVGLKTKHIKDICSIDTNFQLIIVNGLNLKNKLKIDKLINKHQLNKKIMNLGFVDNIDVLMSASDMILGKSGCISINEALNKNLPMFISFNPPGQEHDNMEFLVKRNIATYIPSPKYTKNVLEKYIKDPELLKEFLPGIEKLKKPNACCELVKFVLEQMSTSKHVKILPLVGTKSQKKKIIKNKKTKIKQHSKNKLIKNDPIGA